MSFIYSDEILKEFVRLSEQQKDDISTPVDFDTSQFDLIPNINNDLAIDGQPTFVTAAIVSNAEDDAKTILEKRYPVEPEDLIEKAHPEPVMVADHPVGGLVENQNEQHQRMLNVVNKMPTGFPLNSWASITQDLIKIAQECDDLGLETEAAAIDEVVDSFFLIHKEAGFWDLVKSMGVGGIGIASWLGRLAVANPIAAGIVGAVMAGAGTFWTLWDGIKQDLTTDIQDMIDELDDYQSDADFAGQPGFKEIYGAAKGMQQTHNELMSALASRGSDAVTGAKAAKLYNQLGQQLSIIEKNFPLFEAASPKNVARKLLGFDNIKGRISDLRDLYNDLGKAAQMTNNEIGPQPGESDPSHGEHSKTGPSKVADIKRFLKENDVSEMVGYQYEVDDSPEMDATTHRILSDMGDHIRQQLGTSTPTTKELMNSSYDGLEKLMQIYHEPWNFMK